MTINLQNIENTESGDNQQVQIKIFNDVEDAFPTKRKKPKTGDSSIASVLYLLAKQMKDGSNTSTRQTCAIIGLTTLSVGLSALTFSLKGNV